MGDQPPSSSKVGVARTRVCAGAAPHMVPRFTNMVNYLRFCVRLALEWASPTRLAAYPEGILAAHTTQSHRERADTRAAAFREIKRRWT